MPCTPGTELNGKNDGSKHLSDRGECGHAAELEILMDRESGGKYSYDLEEGFAGGFVSTSLISKPLAVFRKQYMSDPDPNFQGFVPLRTAVAGAASQLGSTPGCVLVNTKNKTIPGGAKQTWNIDKAFQCGYTKDGATTTRFPASWDKDARKRSAYGCGCQKLNHITSHKVVPTKCQNWCELRRDTNGPFDVMAASSVLSSAPWLGNVTPTTSPTKSPTKAPSPSFTSSHPWPCAWQQEHEVGSGQRSAISKMLQVQEDAGAEYKYNELVIDSKMWREHLPYTIDAFFYPVGDITCPSSCQQFVKKSHLNFLKYYNKKQGALYDPDLHSHYVPLLELDRTNMTHPFTLSNDHSKYTVTDEVIAQWKQYFVVFFPLVFVLFPIIVTCISAITATIEKGVHNARREWTGAWLMCTRFIPYYLYLPTMIAWYGAYAIARSSDLKWGNRPDSTESSGEVIETARILVGLSVTTNLLIAAVSI